jgi:D-alanine--poly(phosphoribitol) ligase subunit 2
MTANGTARDGSDLRERALAILQQVTGDQEVLVDPDLPLYTSGLLDSLATVSLIVAFEENFGLTISPAEFDREAWATPRALVADIERRMAQGSRG